MTDEDRRSVVINIPKPKVYDKKWKDIIKKKEIRKKTTKTKRETKKYSLPNITDIKPVPIATFHHEEIFLPYLRYSKKQEQDRFKEKLQVSIADDYKIAYTDLRKRLDTEDPVDDVQCVTDFDPTFFTCVKGSTLSSYVAPFKSLKHIFNCQLRWRQEVGYRRDCMINIDTKYNREQEVYHTSLKRCTEQVKYLDEFISDDYQKSMSLLGKCETLKTQVDNKAQELQILAADKFTMTSKILGLDYRYGVQQKYGRFLYYLSPPSWRLKNRNFARSVEIEARGFDFGMSSEEDTFNVIFEKIKKECACGLVKPVLYFKNYKELLNIFDVIEQQHLHHFSYVARLGPHTSFLKKGIKLFKDIIAQDSAGIATDIKEFETMLSFREQQSSQLENKFYKILNNMFYESVGAPEVLKFQFHLEFCYAKVYNENPMNLGIMGTAKALEDFYMDYSQRLESATSETITTAIKQSAEMERLKYKRAKVAARELRLFERLEHTLLLAYAPKKSSKERLPIVHQKLSRHITKKYSQKDTSKQINVYQKKITDTEKEYLKLFTDWTEKDDPANYLRRLSIHED